MSIGRRLTVLCVFGLAPALLPGQGPFRSVGAGAGLLAPAGGFGQVESAGWHLLATGVGTLKRRVDFRIDGVFGKTAHDGGVGGSTTLAGGAASVQLYLGGEARTIRPFVTAGVGFFRVNIAVDGFPSASATKFTPTAGGGVLIGTGRRRFFIAARYLSVQTSPESTAFLPITAGVMLFRAP